MRKLFASLLTLCLMATLFSVTVPAYAATANNTFAFGDSGSNITISIPTLLGKTTVTIAGENAAGIWETYEKEVLIASAPTVGDSLYILKDTTGKRKGDCMNVSGAYFPVGKGLHYDEESWSAEAKALIGDGLIATGQYMGDMMNFATKSSYAYPSYDKDFPYIYSLVTDIGNTIHGINGENLGSDILVIPSSLLSNYKISALPVTKPSNAVTAYFTASTIYINGTAVAFDAYFINGNNYLKLRDLAYQLGRTEKTFEVAWDGATNAIGLYSSISYTPVGGEMIKSLGATYALPTNSKILLNGSEIKLTAYNIGGNNYFKLRDLGAAINFSVTWDSSTRSVMIDTREDYFAELSNTPNKIVKDKNGNMTIGGLLEYTVGSVYPNTPAVTTNEHWASNYADTAKDILKYTISKSLDSTATRYDLAFITFSVYNMNNRESVDTYYNTPDATAIVFTDFSSDRLKNSFINGFVHFGIMEPISNTEFGVSGPVSEDFMIKTFKKVW